jgi:hypothetical protein
MKLVYGSGPDTGNEFTTSRVRYDYKPATTGETTNRIHIPIEVSGIRAEAVLDTGAPYCVMAPWLAAAAGIGAKGGLEDVTMRVRNGKITGQLHRVQLRLLADEGEDVEVDAVTVIPDVRGAHDMGDLPCFIGMRGCLEAIRFALDPGNDLFFFGRQE